MIHAGHTSNEIQQICSLTMWTVLTTTEPLMEGAHYYPLWGKSGGQHKTIKCKAVLVNKLMIRIAIIGGGIVLALFLALSGKWDYISIYTLSVVILAPMLIYVFYLNRFELIFIGVENENVHLSFVNNSIYKRKDIKTPKDNITVEQKGDDLLFSINNKVQAILRKAAVDASDWDRVLQTFTKPRIVG